MPMDSGDVTTVRCCVGTKAEENDVIAVIAAMMVKVREVVMTMSLL